MGYESKLIVIDKSDIFDNELNMRFGEKIATFDLSKVPSVARDVRNYPDTDTYFYADDGDTQVAKDAYGQPLKEIPIPDMIQILERAAVGENYRRYAPCIQMLKGFDLSQWKNIVVLHFGH